jgi:hypothetical protein
MPSVIDTAALIVLKASKYGSNPTSTDFLAKSADVYAMVLADINMSLGIQLVIVANNITFDINGVDQQIMYSVISLGFDWYMVQNGVWEIDDPTELERRYRAQLGHMWGIFSQNRHQEHPEPRDRRIGLKCRFGHIEEYPHYRGYPYIGFPFSY